MDYKAFVEKTKQELYKVWKVQQATSLANYGNNNLNKKLKQ